MYKIASGIFINKFGEIQDKRIEISFDNQILTKFLYDVNDKKVRNLTQYLEGLNLDEKKKESVKECISFCENKRIIVRNMWIVNSEIWSNSRAIMLTKFFLIIVLLSLPIILFYFLVYKYSIKVLLILIEFYFVHLISIFIHESSHSIMYWFFNRNSNGYYRITRFSFSFIYNKKRLKKWAQIFIALSGSLITISFLILGFILDHPNFKIVLSIEIFLQVFSLFFGSDGKIIIRNLRYLNRKR